VHGPTLGLPATADRTGVLEHAQVLRRVSGDSMCSTVGP
jgi:hypothetical protein